jgi:hypothetical protein
MMTSPRPHWLRFSLQKLFVVVTSTAAVVAMLAYLGRQAMLTIDRQEFLANHHHILGATWPKPPLVRRLLGDKSIEVVRARMVSGEWDRARALFPEATIMDVTDDQWQSLLKVHDKAASP